LTRRINFYLDRFEGDAAVLLVEGEEVNFPRKLLPAGVREGDHLVVSLGIDVEARTAAEDEISQLRQHLDAKGEEK
jgi:hypothetical protein